MIKRSDREKEFAGRLRSIIVEFISVFFIVALNGTILIMVLTTLLDRDANRYEMSLFCFLYLLFGCAVSTALIYFVKGRIYYNKIKCLCDVAKLVAKGNLNVRIPIYFNKPKSEIDYLSLNFNKMLAEISSLENMRNDFVADVSHEIKTPLSVVQGYADLLRNEGLSREQRTEYINRLLEASASLSNLVTNILKLNKIENQEIIQKERFSLDELLRYCILSFEEKLDEKNIALEADLDEFYLESDRSLLEIVWNNLISNALKYTDCGGTLSVELKNLDGKACVRVSDSGCGMSRETLKHCFDKFYQGDASRSQEGNGLGLALVKQVVSMLGGTVSVESKINEGTTFSVIL